ncbi:MAG: amino acid permease, partial [Cyanobacteriota bacterium]
MRSRHRGPHLLLPGAGERPAAERAHLPVHGPGGRPAGGRGDQERPGPAADHAAGGAAAAAGAGPWQRSGQRGTAAADARLQFGLRRSHRHRSNQQQRHGLPSGGVAQRSPGAAGIDRNASRDVSGISALAHQSGLVYVENGPTLLYQLGGRIFGDGPLLALLQLATLLILLLAANTAYADFPRLAAFLARDGFLPRQLASLGDRLVFSNGIYALSGFAALLLIVFQGSVSRLIPLYAVGVFLSFTLSQTGMVVHWWKGRGRGWLSKALINGLGALITAVVTVVLLLSKFTHGAWLVVLTIPILVAIFLRIRTHYNHVARRLRLARDVRLKLPPPPPSGGTPTVVLVGQRHRGTCEAIRFARTSASDLVAV